MDKQINATKFSYIPLKIFAIAFAFIILINILEFTHGLFKLFYGVLFYNSIKNLSTIICYLVIGYQLLKITSSLKSGLIDFIAETSLKRLSKIWIALIALLVFKVTWQGFILFYSSGNYLNQSLLDKLGYSKSVQIATHSDLLIAIFIVWVLMYVLNYAIKLQKEQDLTI